MGLISDADIGLMIKSLGTEEQIILHSSYADLTLYAVVDIGYKKVEMGDGTVAAKYPTAVVKTADVEDILSPGELSADGTYATVRGTSYRVLEHQPDKHGFSTLILGRDE